jgi:hypothetical protein
MFKIIILFSVADKKVIIQLLEDVLDTKLSANDFISLSIFIIIGHNKITICDFSTEQYKNLFKEKLEQILENLSQLSVLDKDIYYSLKMLKSEISFSRTLETKYKNFDPNSSYFHIEDQIPLKESTFEIWLNNNTNPKVLVEKIFFDICSKSGHFENNNVDIFKKRLDDLARFLEYDYGVCAAIALASEKIYVSLNKNKKNFDKFKQLCDELFDFFKLLLENCLSTQNEKDDSLKYIYISYMNNIKVTEKANDAQRMNSFYDKLQQNIDLQVDKEDLLVVKCKLFIRFKNFVKNLYKNDPNNIFIKCLKINSNEKVDIQYVPNAKEIHCEIAIYDPLPIKLYTMDQIDFKYIAISKLCCPLCYFVLSRLCIETRGCHPLIHYWPLSQVYINELKQFHGDMFSKNFEISKYKNDIYKSIIHLPLLFNKLKQENCKIFNSKH